MSLGPKQMEEAIFRNLPKNTGKTLDEWVKALVKSKVKGIKEQIIWLKEQGLGSVQAAFIVNNHNKVENIYDDGDKLINDLFSGENKKYRKEYDALIKKIKLFGKDISVRPCKTYIPVYRKKQFATIRPTKHGVAIGLAIKEAPKSKRIVPPLNNIGSERIIIRIIYNAYSEN
ncbi:MAG: DUF4287 domain-containing protein [Ignavibacteriae bacterium]|nr:DUF4287 domain-containing protein [Ignavibacteriota bacterium]